MLWKKLLVLFTIGNYSMINSLIERRFGKKLSLHENAVIDLHCVDI